MRGAFAAALTRREPLRIAADGHPWPETGYLAVAAGTTPDIGFGFRAFQRCRERPGCFHAIGLTGSLFRVALSMPRLRRGAPWRADIARDAVVRELVLDGDGVRFTLDGHLYAAVREVRVETGPSVELVLP